MNEYIVLYIPDHGLSRPETRTNSPLTLHILYNMHREYVPFDSWKNTHWEMLTPLIIYSNS